MARTPHINYLRNRTAPRTRNSRRLLAWLTAQATALELTLVEMFALLGISNSRSAAVVVAPANTVVPAITGTTAVGDVLAASTGTWTGIPYPSFTYQWKRGGVAISGATSSSYTLVALDAGTNITVTVTATNSMGTASATSVAKAIP